MVPEGWKFVTLGAVCLPKGGLQTGPFGSQLHAYEYVSDGVPVVMPRDLDSGRIMDVQIARVPQDKVDALAKYKLKPGDIVFARRGEIGRYAVVSENEKGWLCGTGCLRVRLLSGMSSTFLGYQIGLPKAIIWLNSNAVGQTMLNLNTEILGALPLLLPPPPEQERIASILSIWDTSIAQTEKLIEAKQKLKKGLMQQLLTGKRRFLGFEELWHEKKLGEAFYERKETNCHALSLLSVTGGRGVIPHGETERKDSSAEDKSKYKRIAPGDIGYNTMRMWQGVSALSSLEGIVSPAYTICVPKKDIDGAFAAHLFKFPPVVHLFYRYSQGLVSDTLNLKFPNFAQVTVALPPLPEQKKIASVLDSLDQEIESLVDLSDRIKEQKRGLMQKLLTGQIRVKATEEATVR